MYYNNQFTIDSFENLEFYTKSKNINIEYDFVKNDVKNILFELNKFL